MHGCVCWLFLLSCMCFGRILFLQDFQGFLNDLQDWELSSKGKDKKLKPQASNKEKEVLLYRIFSYIVNCTF